MRNSLRCCLACVLPCGALDLIRVVHLNGYVQELTGRVTAGEVLKDNPDHVLTKPCGSQGAGRRRILILLPESELKRGSIYFLIPASSLPDEKKSKTLKKKDYTPQIAPEKIICTVEITPEKKLSSRRRGRDRRKCSVELWRPYLESVTEDL